ncbi:MAG: Fic family protein [Candidatus Electrothrix scaldis]|nr:MAG: Fic family protein [Candidatus Electrothrix sp. GW3-3]
MSHYLQNLDPDLRAALRTQLRDLWTHTSTALEGNTLTLGDTSFVLKEGLTVAGKPLKDHQEVVGHARAIDLLHEYLQQGDTFGETELFALHKAVQTEAVFDYYKPVGAWKNQPNSTAGTVDGKQVIFEYAAPAQIPALMENWLALYRDQIRKTEAAPNNPDITLIAYVQLHAAFVRIHPFADGNGRMARLVANLPVLRAGLPPIIIPREQRKEYIDALSAWHFAAGQIKAGEELVPEADKLKPFTELCRQAWQASISLVEEARKRQEVRNSDVE